MPILPVPTDPEQYPGEHQDLVNDLNAARQQLTEMFGLESALFQQIDSALRGGNLPALRAAQAEVQAFLKAAFGQVLGDVGNNPEVLAEIARKMDEIKASKARDFLDWLAEHDASED